QDHRGTIAEPPRTTRTEGHGARPPTAPVARAAAMALTTKAPLAKAPRVAGSGLRRRRALTLLGLVVAVVVGCLLSVAVGAKSVPLDAVWSALTAGGGSEDDVVVLQL